MDLILSTGWWGMLGWLFIGLLAFYAIVTVLFQVKAFQTPDFGVGTELPGDFQ